MKISKRVIDAIIAFEVGSPSLYRKKYSHPVLPGVDSGITIGIGYDLGHASANQIEKDWKGYVSSSDLVLLMSVAGLKKDKARQQLSRVSKVTVSYEAASAVFIKDLGRYSKQALSIYPSLDALFPDAIGAIVSLVYNRGSLIDDSNRRKEMKALIHLIATHDYQGMAMQFRLMKRLWTVKGLLLRRDKEADFIQGADRIYSIDELIEV